MPEHVFEEAHVHILDDPADLSERARVFLSRAGHRESATAFQVPGDPLRVSDGQGRTVLAPYELVAGREAFRARYGGLRYGVRRSVLLGGRRHDLLREWDFNLYDDVRAVGRGWAFRWAGVDGRFIEVASSLSHLIEGHAVMDMVASWDPWPAGSLEAWVPGRAGTAMTDGIEGLAPVPEASSPFDAWLLSEHVAVRRFQGWVSRSPRPWGVQLWTKGYEGRERIRSESAR
ncbi:hypothetical protein [Actinomadura sp. 21ATH]|uniref:hypothetical protein n=1 Tax=Actinomadura sp. 21ATH TaxID=1735444 RepID=UPI0035C0A976